MSSTTAYGRVRIGDAERDAAAAALGEHFASGRLTRDEFDERLESAWAAKTAVDLDPLFVDLPGTSDRLAEPPGGAAPTRFPDGRNRRAGAPRWGRPPFGLPPPFAFVLMVAIVITVVTHLPFVLFVLGALWWTGILGHRGPRHVGRLHR